MPSTHRAFVFDLDRFDAELRPILEESLQTRDPAPLRAFVETHRADLRDPYAGEPLDAEWENLLETRDVQEYGDFALTRYYDPAADVGLGDRWPALEELLVREAPAGTDLTMGEPVGPPMFPFDPGGLGAYFLSNADARLRLDTLQQLVDADAALREPLQPAIKMFAAIAASGRGAYVTF